MIYKDSIHYFPFSVHFRMVIFYNNLINVYVFIKNGNYRRENYVSGNYLIIFPLICTK